MQNIFFKHIGTTTLYQKFLRFKVVTAKVSDGKVSLRRNIIATKYSYGEVFYGENSKNQGSMNQSSWEERQ